MPRVKLGARLHEPRHRPVIAILLGALAFVAYVGNGHVHRNGDTVPASMVAATLLLDRTFLFDRFADAELGELAYFLVRTPRGVMSIYPAATGVLAAPLMAPAFLTLRVPSTEAWRAAAHRQEKYAAALITAVSVTIFALLCGQLGFGNRLTIGLTLFYALGSQAFSTSSQLLWQHGPGTLFILLAVFYFARFQVRATRDEAVCFAISWAVAVAIRPMNILVVGPMVVLAFYRFPRIRPHVLLPAVLVGLPVVAYNMYYFGTLGGGYATQPFGLAHLGSGIAGLLVSPGRGLFFYIPVAAVAVVLALRRRVWAGRDIARAALVAVAALGLFYGSYEHWHGGHSIGPRYLTEIQPLLLVVLGLAWPPRARILGAVCFGVLLPYCIFVQAVGAYSTGPARWNNDRVPDGLAALWDFRDNPIAHAFR
jgi:hypothetical protein